MASTSALRVLIKLLKFITPIKVNCCNTYIAKYSPHLVLIQTSGPLDSVGINSVGGLNCLNFSLTQSGDQDPESNFLCPNKTTNRAQQ